MIHKRHHREGGEERRVWRRVCVRGLGEGVKDIWLWDPPWPPDCSKMSAMRDPRAKRKREGKINTAQLNTSHGSLELRGICYLLNSLLHFLHPPNPLNFPQSLMHELLVLSSDNLTFVVWTGLKRLREKTEEVRSGLAYWSRCHQLCSTRQVALVVGEEASRSGILLQRANAY